MRLSVIALSVALVCVTGTTSAAACSEKTAPTVCAAIQQDINKTFRPGKHNNFGRYRSFLAIEANKRRNAGEETHDFMDYSAEAYGEGLLWLTVPESIRNHVFSLPADQVREWLFDNADEQKKTLLLNEIAKFRELSDAHRLLWMTMLPKDRIEASKISNPDLLDAFITANANRIIFNAMKVPNFSYLRNSTNLFHTY